MTPGPAGPGTVLLDETALAGVVTELAAAIERDHRDGVVLVGILKGAVIFLADLARAIRAVDVQVDFLAISDYAPESRTVRILMDLAIDVTGRDVILVEDLVDTGLSLAYLVAHVRSRAPRRVDVCALLDRAAHRIVPLPVRYVGREIGDDFVVGYGLHVGERYRNLGRVIVLDRPPSSGRSRALAAETGATTEEAVQGPGGRVGG